MEGDGGKDFVGKAVAARKPEVVWPAAARRATSDPVFKADAFSLSLRQVEEEVPFQTKLPTAFRMPLDQKLRWLPREFMGDEEFAKDDSGEVMPEFIEFLDDPAESKDSSEGLNGDVPNLILEDDLTDSTDEESEDANGGDSRKRIVPPKTISFANLPDGFKGKWRSPRFWKARASKVASTATSTAAEKIDSTGYLRHWFGDEDTSDRAGKDPESMGAKPLIDQAGRGADSVGGISSTDAESFGREVAPNQAGSGGEPIGSMTSTDDESLDDVVVPIRAGSGADSARAISSTDAESFGSESVPNHIGGGANSLRALSADTESLGSQDMPDHAGSGTESVGSTSSMDADSLGGEDVTDQAGGGTESARSTSSTDIDLLAGEDMPDRAENSPESRGSISPETSEYVRGEGVSDRVGSSSEAVGSTSSEDADLFVDEVVPGRAGSGAVSAGSQSSEDVESDRGSTSSEDAKSFGSDDVPNRSERGSESNGVMFSMDAQSIRGDMLERLETGAASAGSTSSEDAESFGIDVLSDHTGGNARHSSSEGFEALGAMSRSKKRSQLERNHMARVRFSDAVQTRTLSSEDTLEESRILWGWRFMELAHNWARSANDMEAASAILWSLKRDIFKDPEGCGPKFRHYWTSEIFLMGDMFGVYFERSAPVRAAKHALKDHCAGSPGSSSVHTKMCECVSNLVPHFLVADALLFVADSIDDGADGLAQWGLNQLVEFMTQTKAERIDFSCMYPGWARWAAQMMSSVFGKDTVEVTSQIELFMEKEGACGGFGGCFRDLHIALVAEELAHGLEGCDAEIRSDVETLSGRAAYDKVVRCVLTAWPRPKFGKCQDLEDPDYILALNRIILSPNLNKEQQSSSERRHPSYTLRDARRLLGCGDWRRHPTGSRMLYGQASSTAPRRRGRTASFEANPFVAMGAAAGAEGAKTGAKGTKEAEGVDADVSVSADAPVETDDSGEPRVADKRGALVARDVLSGRSGGALLLGASGVGVVAAMCGMMAVESYGRQSPPPQLPPPS